MNNQMNDSRTDQCLNNIQKYEKWGKLLVLVVGTDSVLISK